MFDLLNFVDHVDEKLRQADWVKEPYGHSVIDGFLPEELANIIGIQCDEPSLKRFIYNSPIEKKDAFNQWNEFSDELYAVFAAMNHAYLTESLTSLTGINGLFLDAGLHGGGIHRTQRGGRLNLHIDYAIHPKLHAERRLNLIIYLNKEWNSQWGGQLELWSGKDHPEHKFATIEPLWNRAVLFATGNESWHGFPKPIECPQLIHRNSIAMYYCTFPRLNTAKRYKAKFVPAADQLNDSAVQELCDQRASKDQAANVYRSQM